MTRKTSKNELLDDVTNEDMRDIDRFLAQHEVKYPSESEVNRTVEELRLHMVLISNRETSTVRAMKLIRLMSMEVTMFHPSYWITLVLLYAMGYLGVLVSGYLSPPLILFLLAPLPGILGAVELYRSRDERMLELEMSCVHNGASVMLAKLFLVGCTTVCLNLVFTWGIAGYSSTSIMQLTLLWLAPFTVISGLAMLAVARLRGSAAIMLVLSLWGTAAVLLLMKPAWQAHLLAVSSLMYVPVVLAGAALIALQLQRMLRMIHLTMEGEYAGEADH